MVKTSWNFNLYLWETVLLVDVRQLVLPLLMRKFVMVGVCRSSSARRQLGRAGCRVERRDRSQDISRRVVWMSDPDYWLTAVRADSREGVRRRGLGRW